MANDGSDGDDPETELTWNNANEDRHRKPIHRSECDGPPPAELFDDDDDRQ